MGFPFLCLSCRTQQPFSGLGVCSSCALPGWVKHCSAPAPFVPHPAFLGQDTCLHWQKASEACPDRDADLDVWNCSRGSHCRCSYPEIQIQREHLHKVPDPHECGEQGCSGQQAGDQSSWEGLWKGPLLIRTSAQGLSSLADPYPGCKTGESNHVSASWNQVSGREKMVSKVKMSPRY